MLRGGVVGAGGGGKNLVRNFAQLDGCELVSICDVNQATLATYRTSHPSVECTTKAAEVFANPRIDAVVVAVDAGNHHAVVRDALLAGKHVFVEKPLTLKVEDSLELVQLARRAQRRLMVGHLLIYHPALVAVNELCRAGELGDLYYLYSQRVSLGIIRSNENAWWSLAPHDISTALWLFGDVPESVSANGAIYLQRNKSIEDVVFALLRFRDGRVAQIHVSWLDPNKSRRLTIVGSKKMLAFDDTVADEKIRIYDKGASPRPGYASYEEGVAVRSGSILIPSIGM